MTTPKATELKNQILELTKEYYAEAFKEQPFIAGTSHVNYGGRFFDEKEMVNLIDSSLDFWLTSGPYTKQFEKKLAQMLGVPTVYLTTSGSSANLLAFMSLTSDMLGERKVKRGDEVITVACGFPTTVSPIVQYGAVPVFVDVEIPSYNIDVSKLEEALSPKTKAVMVAHTLGNPFNIEAVKNFCDKHQLWLIEDNCDALGTTYKGKYSGTFGDLGTCSFYPPHHITMGEGGVVIVNNPKLRKIVLSIRDWGRDCWCPSGVDNTCGKRFDWEYDRLPQGYDHKYVYSHFGYNLKVTDMQAAIGLAQLDKLEFIINRRRINHDYLTKGLKPLEHLFHLPVAEEHSNPSWFGFLLTPKATSGINKVDLVRHLESKKIQTRMLFAGNLLMHPCFDEMKKTGEGYRVVGELKNTDYIMHHTFWVGVYPGMTTDKLDHIIESILEFVQK